MGIVPKFRKAARTQCKASVVIDGLSGTGKTGLALALAYGLSGDWESIAAVDSENKSMDLYEGQMLHTGVRVGAFNVQDLTAEDGYKPSYFSAFRDEAIRLGYKALICDSISHMWQYKGGVLDMVSEAQRKDPRANNYTVWGSAEISSEKNLIFAMIRHPKIHCINTLRVKEKMEMVTGDTGKMIVQSLGEQQIIAPDFKYEPDLVLSMLSPGDDSGRPPRVMVDKSRYSVFKVNEEYNMTAEIIEQLRLFLEEGISPEELDEMQRVEYVNAIKERLDSNPSSKAVWEVLKEQAGVKGIQLKDIPLAKLKVLFSQLIA